MIVTSSRNARKGPKLLSYDGTMSVLMDLKTRLVRIQKLDIEENKIWPRKDPAFATDGALLQRPRRTSASLVSVYSIPCRHGVHLMLEATTQPLLLWKGDWTRQHSGVAHRTVTRRFLVPHARPNAWPNETARISLKQNTRCVPYRRRDSFTAVRPYLEICLIRQVDMTYFAGDFTTARHRRTIISCVQLHEPSSLT